MLIGVSGKINSGKDTIGKIIQILLNSPHLNNEGVMTFLRKNVGDNGSWQIKKFADKLKDIVCLLIGCTREQLEDREFKEKELGEEWTKYQYYSADQPNVEMKMTPRLLLQLLGTECGRQIIHPNIWVNSMFSDYIPYYQTEFVNYVKNRQRISKQVGKSIPIYPNWIITDTRFPNELKAVKDKGGITIRVNRFMCSKCGNTDNFEGGNDLCNECGHFKSNDKEHESETALDNTEFDYVIDNNGSIEELVEKVREILIKEKLL